jgi:hypothetical protein
LVAPPAELAIMLHRGSLADNDLTYGELWPMWAAISELRRLVEEGLLELVGERRGAHYVPGPRMDDI